MCSEISFRLIKNTVQIIGGTPSYLLLKRTSEKSFEYFSRVLKTAKEKKSMGKIKGTLPHLS